MVKRALNDRMLKSFKPAEAGKRYEAMDSVVPGFGLSITSAGQKTFVLVARFPGSKNPTRRAIGSYGAITLDKARQTARDWLESIQRGIDPGETAKRQREDELSQRRNTFAAVAADFIRDKLSTERKGGEIEADIRREFIPRWGNLPIAQITESHVMDMVKAVKDRGKKYQAHNLLAEARRLFSWAIDQRAYGLEFSPCDKLKPTKIIGKKIARTRVLGDDEWRALWRATEAMGYPYGPLLRMLALTGQRKSEVAEARWPEFDLAAKLWVIPASRMKMGAAHVVPLTDDVLELLRSLPRFSDGPHLFSTDRGVKPVNGFGQAKTKLDRLTATELGRAVEPFVIHDVRRSMRTGLSALPGVPDLVRELVIAHTKPGLHKVYDLHVYEAEKRHALELWAAPLRNTITRQRLDNVVALHGAAS